MLTYRQGILSSVGHDLRLRVTGFTIDISDDQQMIEAVFDANSVRVDSAMRDGKPLAGTLSERDRKQIEGNVVRDVLEAERFPEIRFASGSIARREDRALIAGTLTLHGYSRLLTMEATLRNGVWTTDARIYQPDYAIRPFSAMLGTLKIQPDLRVQVILRLPTL